MPLQLYKLTADHAIYTGPQIMFTCICTL